MNDAEVLRTLLLEALPHLEAHRGFHADLPDEDPPYPEWNRANLDALIERINVVLCGEALLSEFAAAVLVERQRQVFQEGWSRDHDDGHHQGELARAAAVYAYTGSIAQRGRDEVVAEHGQALWGVPEGFLSVVRWLWPFDPHWFKPQSRRRDLERAGALIIAEGERLDRAAAKGGAA